MNKYFITAGLAVFPLMQAWAYADIASFVVTVTPDTFVEGEPVDVEVRAVDANGDVVTDFKSDIFLGIKETGVLTQDDYTLPSDGRYAFELSDQGIKTFSKGLIIKKPGTYTVFVEDIYDTSVTGETSIVVTSAGGVSASAADVTITSPTQDTILDRETVTIIGTSDAPRSPLAVDVNGTLVETAFVTDATGGFSLPLDGLVEGSNTLTVHIQNADGETMGSSDPLTVRVELDDEPDFQRFAIDPAENLMVDMEADVLVEVSDQVTSVSLMVDGAAYPLDRDAAGKYTGVISFQDPGTYELKVRTYIQGEMTEHDVDDVEVLAPVSYTGTDYGISMISFLTDPLEPGTVRVSREPTEEMSPYYTLYYGTNPESLERHFTVQGTGATIRDLPLDEKTYVQVRPTSKEGDVRGDPSDPLVVSFQAAAPQCIVKGIELRSVKRGSDYYLVWDAVDGAESYTIYRSASETSRIDEMTEVGSTTNTEYQYPFDPNASYEQYAYYAVEAHCDDGLNAQVDGVERVKVGPASSALMVLLLVVGIYFLYRVNMYEE